MKTLTIVLLLLTSLVNAQPPPAMAPPNPNETRGGVTNPLFAAASAEASHWMTLIDQGQFASSWLDAAPLFKDIITREQWVAAMVATRRPLGNVRARQVGRSEASQSLPGGTQGAFMIIRYNTDFANRSGLEETVTLMMIRNDQWRVVSYSVR